MPEQNKEEVTTMKEEEKDNNLQNFSKFKRTGGILDSVDHAFNDDGSINWRAMIKPNYLYPNRDWFELRKQAVPNSIEGLEDRQLLITLPGLREVAKLRGFRNVSYDVTHVEANYVMARCKIEWIGNYESQYEPVTYEEVANATAANTDDFCLKFLETIACNRAFVRCVRNFLNIHIVGSDEIDKSKNRVADISDLMTSNVLPITPQGTLEKVVNEKLKLHNFDSFHKFLRQFWKEADQKVKKSIEESLLDSKEWESFKDIPAKNSRLLLKLINEYKTDN